MGIHSQGAQSKTGPTHGGSAPVTKSPVGTPLVVDLYNDQLPPGRS